MTSMTPTPRHDFVLGLREIADVSLKVYLSSDIPPELLAAMLVLESNYLRIRPGNNPLVIPFYTGASGRQLLMHRTRLSPRTAALINSIGPTTGMRAEGIDGEEGMYRVWAWYATFPTIEDCIRHRAKFLMKWNTTDDFSEYCYWAAFTIKPDKVYASKIASLSRSVEIMDAIGGALERLDGMYAE